MTRVPDDWIKSDLHFSTVCHNRHPLDSSMGWTFWEHPTKGDEGHVLAITLDRIEADGPVVYDTGEYEVPDYM